MWIAFFLLILLILFLVFPLFRKVILIIAGVLGAIIFIFYAYNENEQSMSKKRISPTEIQISELRLAPERYSSSSYKLLGRIKNNSQRYTLDNLEIKVVVQDCVEGGSCETVGEGTTSYYYSIPPGQAREMDSYISFHNMPQARGHYKWNYSIVEVKGK
jgi:hypothetical protein